MNPIDKKLHEWGEATRATAEACPENLAGALTRALHQGPPPRPTPTARRPLWRWVLATACVALMVGGIAGYLVGANHHDQVLAGVPPEELAEAQVVADELERVFGGQVQWLRQGSELTIEPGSPEPGPPTGQRILVVLRVDKAVDHEQWQTVSRQDLVLREDHEFSINKVSLWCHLTGDGMVTVSGKVPLQLNGFDLRLSTENLQPLGKPQLILRMAQDGTLYRVVQSVHII